MLDELVLVACRFLITNGTSSRKVTVDEKMSKTLLNFEICELTCLESRTQKDLSSFESFVFYLDQNLIPQRFKRAQVFWFWLSKHVSSQIRTTRLGFFDPKSEKLPGDSLTVRSAKTLAYRRKVAAPGRYIL